MSGPIYKSFRLKFTEAWYQLSQDEQNSLLAKVTEALEKAGGKSLVIYNSSWSAEDWDGFGLEEFPDIEAVQKHTQLLNELNWLRYVRSSTLLGVKM